MAAGNGQTVNIIPPDPLQNKTLSASEAAAARFSPRRTQQNRTGEQAAAPNSRVQTSV